MSPEEKAIDLINKFVAIVGAPINYQESRYVASADERIKARTTRKDQVEPIWEKPSNWPPESGYYFCEVVEPQRNDVPQNKKRVIWWDGARWLPDYSDTKILRWLSQTGQSSITVVEGNNFSLTEEAPIPDFNHPFPADVSDTKEDHFYRKHCAWYWKQLKEAQEELANLKATAEAREKERAIAFAKWTAEGLWAASGDMWYEYRNEDNPISGEQLYDLFLQQSQIKK